MSQSCRLERFIEAQAPVYATALAEIQRGAKRSHWMWFIFPQLTDLGRSPTALFYGIASIAEARAYSEHPLLGGRYRACVEALQDLERIDPVPVFGATDAMKLRSSLTLFEAADPAPLLAATIDRWFKGERDVATLLILARQNAVS